MNLIFFLFALTIATPAIAQENSYRWGDPGEISELKLEKSETHFANLQFNNGFSFGPGNHTIKLSIDGVLIVVNILHSHVDPDLVTIIVPEGFTAVPSELTVEDGTTAIFEIHEMLLG